MTRNRFLGRISELAFGPEGCDHAAGVNYAIVGFTPDTLTLDVRASRDPRAMD